MRPVSTEKYSKPFEIIHVEQNLLIIVDALSKFAQAIPILGKTAITMYNGITPFFKSGRIPQKIGLDSGCEF